MATCSMGHFSPCLHSAYPVPLPPPGSLTPSPSLSWYPQRYPASPKAQPQDAAEGSFLTRESRASFTAPGSLSCFHHPHCHLPFLACWPHAIAKHCQPLAEPWWCLALPLLAVPEKQPGLCTHAGWSCLLLHCLAKGRHTSLWCHHSLLSLFCMASGAWPQSSTGSCDADVQLCWQQPPDTTVYGQEKLSIPPEQLWESQDRHPPHGEPCWGAQQAQPDRKFGGQLQWDTLPPSSFSHQTAAASTASPSLWTSQELLGREGSSLVITLS